MRNEDHLRYHQLNGESSFAVCPLRIILAQNASTPLMGAVEGWATLNQYIDGLLGTGEEIFDAEAHDNLIFDDDLYLRSRHYFWVINCINKAEDLIQRNI